MHLNYSGFIKYSQKCSKISDLNVKTYNLKHKYTIHIVIQVIALLKEVLVSLVATAAVVIAHCFAIGVLGLAKGGQKLTICTAGEIFHKGIVKGFRVSSVSYKQLLNA